MFRQNKYRRLLVSEGNFSLNVKTIFKEIYGAVDIQMQASNNISREDVEILKKIYDKAQCQMCTNNMLSSR